MIAAQQREDASEPTVIDAASGLDVATVFPWPRTRVSHSGVFSIAPPMVDGATSLLIYVHGYNEDPETAKGYGRNNIGAGYAGSGGTGRMATFLWKSQFGILGMRKSIRAANATAPVFARAVQSIQTECPQMRIHVLAHSLGARVALKAIQDFPIRIQDLALGAPAVDNDALESHGEFCDVAGRVERLLFTHNDADRSLKWYRLRGSRALGARGFNHPGDMPANVIGEHMTDAWQHHGKDGGHGAILHPQY